MGVVQSMIRARGGNFPITVVSAQSAFYQGSAATWPLVAPDPGALNTGDVVLVHLAIQNGRDDVPQPSGWDNLGRVVAGANDEFQSILYGLRMSSGGTIPTADRTWPHFVGSVGSAARISIVVLRGVRNTGPVSFNVDRTFSVVNASLGTPAGLQSQARSAATVLALHFVHTNSGTISGAPSGWASALEVTDSGGTTGGTYYIETAQFTSTGTTAALARTTSPLRRATALVNVYAP
jgi:hypothetical protein